MTYVVTRDDLSLKTAADFDLAIRTLSRLIKSPPGRYSKDSGMGICYHWTRRVEKETGRVDDLPFLPYIITTYLASSWPLSCAPEEFISFPIPHVKGSCWEGEQLKLRMSLMQYMLKRLSEWHLEIAV